LIARGVANMPTNRMARTTLAVMLAFIALHRS
jgi:hypothetical protein